MVDIAFQPDAIEVTRGETVRFVFTNNGDVDHDAFIGNRDAQAEHEDEMRAAGDGHGGGHGDESAVTVEPGESRSSPTCSPNPAQSRSAATSPATTTPAW